MELTCTVVGAKGGTAKTSTVASLAHIYSLSGRTIVMVDADPQGTLTRRSGVDRHPDPLRAAPVCIAYTERRGADGAGRVLLLPGGRKLELADATELAEQLRRARGYGDIVLVDTPPAVGPIVMAAIEAAGLVLVPTVPGEESLDGFSDVLAVAREVDAGKKLRAVLTLANTASRICRWSRAAFAHNYPGVLYDSVIPIEMAAAESGTLRRPVTVSAPGSRAAEAYARLADAIRADLHGNWGASGAPEVSRVA